MKKVWLIGTGLMGKEYARVLRACEDVEYTAIGRGETSAAGFESETGHRAVRGGLERFLETGPELPDAAIVAVGVEALSDTAERLMRYGVKRILLEKPGVGYPAEIESLSDTADRTGSNVVLAYNRRFYSSVLKAEEIIREDGGVSSFCFEFTEWSHVIGGLNKNEATFRNWFIANSTHVVDTAFFLGGYPEELVAFHRGGLPWHPASSVFSGAGVSDRGALFSYHADWEAPGRWVIEILTKKHRLYFKPMESLQIQQIGSVAVTPVEVDNRLDTEFKPGFYLQARAFLDGDSTRFCTLAEQRRNIEKYYLKMCGYPAE